MGKKKLAIGTALLVLVLIVTTVPTPRMTAAETTLFFQGKGYGAGKYDLKAVQPTAFNWSPQSRFTGSPHYDEIWSFETKGQIIASPVIGRDGTIYIGSFDGNFYALNPNPTAGDADRVKWSYKTGNSIESSAAIGADGTVFVGSVDGKLYAFHPDPNIDDKKRVRWSYETGGSIRSSPAIGVDGTIYFGSDDKKVYALDPNPNVDDADRVKWSYETGGRVLSSPAIGTDGTIYVASMDQNLYAFDPDPTVDEKRRVKWSYKIAGLVTTSPAIGADGTVYIHSGWSAIGLLYALNPDPNADYADRLWWSFETSTDGLNLTPAPVVGADGTVYIGSYEKSYLYALNPGPDVDDANRVKWKHFDLPASSPVFGADGTMYLAVQGDAIRAIEPAINDDPPRIKWTIQADDKIYTPAIGADGTIYFGSGDGKLYAVGTHPPAAPANLQATAGDEQVDLTWDAVDGAVGYRVYQFTGTEAPANAANWLLVNDGLLIRDTTHTIARLNAGQQYWFAVRAVRKGGSPSDLAPPVAATPTTHVTQVSPMDPIQVARGTQLIDVPLPQNAHVHLDNGTEADVDVIWDLETAVYDATQPGTYTITGDLVLPDFVRNPLSLRAEVSVVVPRPPSAPGLRSSNANLKTLEVWADGKLVALAPSFRADTTAYTAVTTANQVEIKAATEHTAANVAWQDQALGDGIQIDLQPGENSIQLVVQAGDGSRQTYTLFIERVSYSDLAGHWAASFIQQATAAGIVSGYPDGTFKPDDSITRAEFTVMMMGALQPNTTGGELTFSDANLIGTWAQQAVAQAVQLAIITGYEDGHFRPDANITRAEMAVMIARALRLPTAGAASTGFADDADIPQWARVAVAAIRQLGLIEGRGDNRFVPNDTATRAEATVMVLRIMPMLQESPH